MMDEQDAVVVMQGPHADLQRAAARLADGGVEAAVVCPDSGSGSG